MYDTKTEQQGLYRVTRVVWYIFYVVEVLLAFRFALKLFAANPSAGFTDIIYTLSVPLVAPFIYVFNVWSIGGGRVEWGTLLALFVYWVLAWGIVKLLLMKRPVGELEARSSLFEQDQ